MYFSRSSEKICTTTRSTSHLVMTCRGLAGWTSIGKSNRHVRYMKAKLRKQHARWQTKKHTLRNMVQNLALLSLEEDPGSVLRYCPGNFPLVLFDPKTKHWMAFLLGGFALQIIRCADSRFFGGSIFSQLRQCMSTSSKFDINLWITVKHKTQAHCICYFKCHTIGAYI